jgi:hypothetical protein
MVWGPHAVCGGRGAWGGAPFKLNARLPYQYGKSLYMGGVGGYDVRRT